jgi:hypothetical protein
MYTTIASGFEAQSARISSRSIKDRKTHFRSNFSSEREKIVVFDKHLNSYSRKIIIICKKMDGNIPSANKECNLLRKEL